MGTREVLELATDRTSPRAARHWVDAVLHRWARDDAIDRVALIASELVTNAVLHEVKDLSLVLELATDRRGTAVVRLEVTDSERDGPAPPSMADDLDEAGLGVPIVEALASSWGRTTTAEGRIVWAEVRG